MTEEPPQSERDKKTAELPFIEFDMDELEPKADKYRLAEGPLQSERDKKTVELPVTEFDPDDLLPEPDEGEPVGAVPEVDPDADPTVWSNPLVTFPGGLTQRMVRVDLDIFDWFKAGGVDFEFRMNYILREAMEKQQQEK